MTVPTSILELYNGHVAEIQVEIVSDLVCPWCFIGKRRLEKAMALRPDVAFQVRWLPFQLHPDLGPEGMPIADVLQRKFGDEAKVKTLVDRIAGAGRADGIAFAFDRIQRVPSTLAAHCLVDWAGPEAGAMAESIFHAYFEEGRDIGDHALLAELGGAAGLDAAEVKARLDRGDDRDRIAAEARAHAQDTRCVPHFTFGGRVRVAGAQQPADLVRAFDAVLHHAA
jgi:predicted DsbA family dithiol-disulfide isomerase